MNSPKRMLTLTPLLMLLASTTATLTLNGCAGAPVKVNDETLYYDKGSSGAHVLHFLTPETYDITQQQWDAIREGDFCLSSQGWADVDKEIGELCSTVTCDYQVQQALKDLFTRMREAEQ